MKKGTKLPQWWIDKARKNRMLVYSTHSKTTREKISQSNKGKVAWNKGLTKEDPRVLSYVIKSAIKNKGRKPWNTDKHWNKEIRDKISKSKQGSKWTLEQRMKRVEMLLNAGFWKKEKNPMWRGGFSLKDYPDNFNRALKNQIRKRDEYKCQVCGVPQVECESILCVHHIDYDKKNCLPENLISLCKNCHIKTNHNREYWMNYFKEKEYVH